MSVGRGTDESKRILWVDDEIELLRPHIMFLNERHYDVTPVSNGDDAIALCGKERFDIVLLDEMMPGRDGLSTLEGISSIDPNLPVVMITKNEEERLMDEAIGHQIADYLIKPVNPTQILSACKRILDSKKIREGWAVRDYITEFNKIRERLCTPLTQTDWVDIHRTLSEWDVELDGFQDAGLAQTQRDQHRECNAEFGTYIQNEYARWVEGNEAPVLSTDVVKEYVVPHLDNSHRVYFIVIDCMRLDQWLTIEPMISEYFTIDRQYYYSILPTATPYSRNAIFSGLFPSEIETKHPDLWQRGMQDESSRNRYERQLMDRQLERLGIQLDPEPKYVKILDIAEARSVARKITTFYDVPLVSMVYNFVDNLAHGRSESELLQEIAPDESGFRTLTKSWFSHSALFDMLRRLSRQDCTVVLTTDHGAVLGMRGTKAFGDRETSTNLRYKYGDHLKCDEKHAMMISDPRPLRLPVFSQSTNYIIAKEDYYFVYPTKFHEYQRQYQDSFQHGGISMEEMILPVCTMRPRHVS
ncbi:MAG: response regulator [Candidatus Latescibacteria bacterium]|jgi:CheY-like chemotaxis protein|nr:response regulator [Candidatus Latescibacterota bacterium]